MSRRYYSSIARRTTLAADVNSSATTILVAATTGFPSSKPFTLVIDVDTASEEIVTVTAASGTTLTVTRGVDGSTAVAHTTGAVIAHQITARDVDEPNAHIDATTSVHGITDTSVLVTTTGTQTLTNKTISQAQVTSLTSDLALKAPLSVTINPQTASYTLVLGDAGKQVEILVTSTANTLTVPPNSSVAFPVGTVLLVVQTGTGQTTLTPGSGVTINGTPGLKLRTQWSSAMLVKRATDTWFAAGDLSA